MKKFARELIFISQINRDGSGTTCNKPSGFDLQSFKEILGID
jgi:hypothetical protein